MFIKALIRIIVLAAVWQSVQAAPCAPDSDTLRSIRAQLEQMRQADQAVRRNFNYLDSKQIEKMRTVDAANQKRLKKIITLIGWPSKELVGENASNGAFFVAQHAGDDLDFMKEVFSHIEADCWRRRQIDPGGHNSLTQPSPRTRRHLRLPAAAPGSGTISAVGQFSVGANNEPRNCQELDGCSTRPWTFNCRRRSSK